MGELVESESESERWDGRWRLIGLWSGQFVLVLLYWRFLMSMVVEVVVVAVWDEFSTSVSSTDQLMNEQEFPYQGLELIRQNFGTYY